jgi:LysM repeat protein
VVQPGDTLSELALQLGTTVEYLAAANSIENPDLLYSGQTIYY